MSKTVPHVIAKLLRSKIASKNRCRFQIFLDSSSVALGVDGSTGTDVFHAVLNHLKNWDDSNCRKDLSQSLLIATGSTKGQRDVGQRCFDIHSVLAELPAAASTVGEAQVFD